MKKLKVFALSLLLLSLAPSHSIAADNGAFGDYLVGFVDSNPESTTRFQVINPTSRTLTVVFGFFDLAGNPTGCEIAELPSNGMLERLASAEGRPDFKPPVAKANVVKIMSIDDRTRRTPVKGIVGFQRHYYPARFWGSQQISESNLASMPEEVLLESNSAELRKIFRNCIP